MKKFYLLDKAEVLCYNKGNKSPGPLINFMHTWGLSVYIRGSAMPKDFKTIKEQMEILKSRGLKIDDEATAAEFLKYNNYYRISGYSLTLRDHDRFYSSASFQNIMDIYNFDHEFRTIIFDIITKIEVNIKSVYAYHFSEKFGSLGYLDKTNFTAGTQKVTYESVITKVGNLVESNTHHEDYLKHFRSINEKIPMWAYIESFTLSDVSKLYSVSEHKLQMTVANEFGLKSNKGYKILSNYLFCLAFLRNICAHGGRLFNRKFNTKPDLNKKEKELLLKNKDGDPDNSHLFGYVINIMRLAQPSDWLCFKDSLIDLCNKYPFVDMSYYGFCNEWYNKL